MSNRVAYLQIPAYREEERLDRTLDAVAAEPVPEGWEVHREVWVTPVSALENDPTYQIADDHPGFEAFEAPPGKLSARNAAHDHAVSHGADCFVTWDADTVPGPNKPLVAILRQFSDPDVVAVNSVPYSRGTIVSPFTNLIAASRRVVVPHMHGQASAISADAWDMAGPFDTNRDQTSLREVWVEEEVRIHRRLRSLGKIKRPTEAVVWSSNRRDFCRIEDLTARHFGRPRSEWCARRGDETFQPAQREWR